MPRRQAAERPIYGLKQAKGRFLPEIELNADVGQQRIDRPIGLGPAVNDDMAGSPAGDAQHHVRSCSTAGTAPTTSTARRPASPPPSFRVLVRSEAVGLNSVEAYIDVVRHNELAGLAQDNVGAIESLLSIIQERYDGGRAPIGDLEQTIERVEAAKALVAQIKVAREATASAKYKNAVGSLRPRR